MAEGRGQVAILDSRLYAALHNATRLVALNLLWLVASLPVVTVLPATAAMFAVLRQWSRGDDPPLARAYLRGFSENLRQASALQLVLATVVAGLYANARLAPVLPGTAAGGLRAAVLVVALLVAAIAVYALPLLVAYRLRFSELVRWSVLLTIGRPGTTACCLVVVAVAATLTLVSPAAVLLVVGVTASTTHQLVSRALADLPAPTANATNRG